MVDDHQQRTALGLVIAFPILSGIAILLRLWARYLSRTKLASDDYLIVAGYILAISQSVTSWYYIKANYVGIHIWDVPKDRDIEKGLIWNFANQILYNPCLTIIKVSILLFLRRLDAQTRVVNGMIWSTMAIVVALFVAVLFVDLFQCHPVAYVYDFSIPGGTCIAQGAFYVSTAAIYLFTDLLVLTIPIIITWRLQMPLRQKIAVCFILCLGGVATAVGVWRIIILAQGFFPGKNPNPDTTYSIGFCSSVIEVNVAVITACGPSFKAISTKFLPRLLGYSVRKNSGYGSTGGSRKFPGSRLFSNGRSSHIRSNGDDDYELADPNGGNRVNVSTGDRFDMRKYRRGSDSPTLSSGSDEGVAGITRTTDVSVQYIVNEVKTSSRSHSSPHGGRQASFDSIV